METEEVIKELGLDVPRTWATKVAVHQSGDLVLLIFRETAQIVGEDGGEETQEVSRNVASILLGMENAKTLGRILYQNFVKEEAEPDGE